jgi:hypothetical protein
MPNQIPAPVKRQERLVTRLFNDIGRTIRRQTSQVDINPDGRLIGPNDYPKSIRRFLPR